MFKYNDICPWWLAYTFETPLRYLNQHPDKILKPYLKEGMTFLDLGCGMGFFSINGAKIVGKNGKVFSVDIQKKMLDVVIKNAKKNHVQDIITTHLSEPGNINLDIKADFALAMWMVHETPNIEEFFKQVKKLLKPNAKLLVVEPTFFHVPKKLVAEEIELAEKAGFEFLGEQASDFFNKGFLLQNK